MKSRTWTILLGCFLSMLIITIMSFALTYGRFSEEKKSSGGSYGSDIEYIVADQIEVKNENEFIGAIENGYSNITISKDTDSSMIITSDVTDVGVDLIINLNGHKLVRNNRKPMLNVKEGVRLTIIDTSAGKTGSFYNPVGSVLMISGGTLTVSGGTFESGPRNIEYADQAASTVEASVYQKAGDKYEPKGNWTMPELDGMQTGVYFTAPFNSFVMQDTYLYYTEEKEGGSIILNSEEGSADFYYQYEKQDGSQIVVYGYNGVKDYAKNETAGVSIVSMENGNMYARGGQYYSYFGVETSYGIYARGGYMAVEAGNFSVIENGTCIRCNYDSVSDKEYLRIANGRFESKWGNTVQVNGGKLAITGGEFEKNVEGANSEQQGSAVLYVTGGSIDGMGTRTADLKFNITGSNVYGIYAENKEKQSAEVKLNAATFTFVNGQKNIGIHAKYAEVTLKGVTIQNADLGIEVDQGSVTCLPNYKINANETDTSLNLTTNAVAIKVNNGSFIAEEEALVEIKSEIKDDSWGNDSVYVSGGNFTSNGTLKITHKGRENEYQSNADGDQLYKNFAIKSYAVRVIGNNESLSNVVITKGEIINSCGGGICVEAGEKDNVTLGSNELTVKTEGKLCYDNYESTTMGGNWNYRQSRDGGHAVNVVGGNLTINDGSFTAEQGDGIRVTGGKVKIFGGSFAGNDSYKAYDENPNDNEDPGPVAGPGASYAFKIYGGTAEIYNGTFGTVSPAGEVKTKWGSGAFVMGTKSSYTDDDNASVKIYGGTFNTDGQAGFSVYEYADILFSEKEKTVPILVSGLAGGIVVEDSANPAKIVIESGKFSSFRNSGNSDGIWYNNANAKLEISGGTFTGVARSGLYFAVEPVGNNVRLSDGNYIGATPVENKNRIYGSYWDNGAISVATSRHSWGWYTGLEISVSEILAQNCKLTEPGKDVAITGEIHTNVSKYKELQVSKS